MQELKSGQIWRHYKGKEYKILLLGKHSETGEEMVAYEQLETGNIYFRPMSLFYNDVEYEGKKVPRFQLLRES